MYIIIKRDKAEHLKEKLHHIKTAALEVLDCIEAAHHLNRHPDEFEADYARGRGMSHDYTRDYDRERERFEPDYARGRGMGRGRY